MVRTLLAWTVCYLLCAVAYSQQAGVIREIEIRGNQNISKDAILAAMTSKVGGVYLPSELAKDETAVMSLGFFKDVKILSRAINDSDWQLIIEIVENPIIREIRITGNTVIPSDKILPLVTQEVGKVFNFRTVAPTSEAIQRLYEEKGYFAQADTAPLPESPGTLNVQVIERAVKDIYIQGLVRTRLSVIRKLLKTKPGQAFSERKWDVDRRRIESTQWFETVSAKSRPTEEIGKFDLLLEVKEARTAQIGFGIALDPTSRLAGNIRYSDNNFNGTGQTVGAVLQQDTQGSGMSAGIDYVNPYLDDRDTSMSLRLYSRVYSYFTNSGFGNVGVDANKRFDERRTGFGFTFGRPFGNIWTASIGATIESIRAVNIGKDITKGFIRQDGDLAVLELELARDRRDVPLDPMEGDYTRLSIEPGFSNITKIGGDVAGITDALGRHTFFRNTVEYKAFFSRRPARDKPIDSPRPVIAFRAKYGVISGTVPFYEQFFVGGSDSLRGYADQRFWGKYTLTSSVEYRYPVQKTFNLIGFVDYGGAWGGYPSLNNFTQSSKLNLNVGYGFGIGFRTPLGPIRVDFGFDKRGKGRTHFSIGGSF